MPHLYTIATNPAEEDGVDLSSLGNTNLVSGERLQKATAID